MTSTVNYIIQTEDWTKNGTVPYNTASVSYVVTKTDDGTGQALSLTTDDAIADAPAQLLIGGQFPSRPLYLETVTWSQDSPNRVIATASYDSVPFVPGDYDSDTVQSIDESTPGYVNCDISSWTAQADFWRWKDPEDWLATNFPWTTAQPLANHQVLIALATDSAVDAAGIPMNRPILGQQLTITMTFPSQPPLAMRDNWRSMRGTRNGIGSFGGATYFLNDDYGVWLFQGSSTRATTQNEMYHVQLNFYRDPFGWCRQRVKCHANGDFTADDLTEIDTPSGTTCGDTDKLIVASCVYWTQLHQTLSDFSGLMTTAQATQVMALVG